MKKLRDSHGLGSRFIGLDNGHPFSPLGPQEHASSWQCTNSRLVQVTNKKRQQLQESQSSSMGEVIDGEPEELLEENMVDEEDEEEDEEEEEEEGHLERAVFALDLADRGSSGSETGVEQFDAILPQPRKERRR